MTPLFKKYLKFSLRSWARETSLRSSTLIILIFTYAVTLFLVTSAFNFKRIINRWGDQAKLTVYLTPGQTPETQVQIQNTLEKNSEVRSVQYISQEEAVSEFSKKNSIFAKDFIDDLKEQDVFPESFEVTLKGNINDQSYMKKITETSAQFSEVVGVEEVSYGQGWIEKYSAFIRLSNSVIGIIILLFVAASILIISNLIRVLIYNHNEEIEILELIGETANNIRWPFIIEGTVFSSVALLIGVFINYFLFRWISTQVSGSSILNHLADLVAKPSLLTMSLSFLMSIFVGAVASYLTIRSINTGWSFSSRSNS